MSQVQGALPVAPSGAVGMEITGVEYGLSLVTCALPRGTGVPDRASGYDEGDDEGDDEPAPAVPGGAFCAPRTSEEDPRGRVQLARVFTGGRFLVWSGPIRWVPP